MTADRAALADLARRLEGGETGEKIDADLCKAAGYQVVHRGKLGWECRPTGAGIWESLPAVTTSLDAIATLGERVLPKAEGWRWKVSNVGHAILWQTRGMPLSGAAKIDDQPAAALALALVRALMARGDAG